MEPKDLVLASLKAHKFINNLKIDDIFKPVEAGLRGYIREAYNDIVGGSIPPAVSTSFSRRYERLAKLYEDLLHLYGVEVLHAHAPDISYLGLKWYIEQGDLVIGTNLKEEEV